jgi:recombination protein RecT
MAEIKTNKALAPIDEVRGSLVQMESQFKMALPPHVTVERFTRVVMTALQTNSSLLGLDRKSLFASCVKAAQDGLLPDGRQGALVPFKDKVQWMPMVAGILMKVRNSGDLASISAQVIHEKDSFKFWTDDSGEHLTHEPLLFGERGSVIGVYALAKTKDGAIYIEVMTSKQVADVKAVSRASNGPWNGPFEHEMWKKTAIRRLSKRLPMSTDLEQTLRRDDDLYDFNREVSQEKGNKLAEMIGVAPERTEVEVPSEGSFEQFEAKL